MKRASSCSPTKVLKISVEKKLKIFQRPFQCSPTRNGNQNIVDFKKIILYLYCSRLLQSCKEEQILDLFQSVRG